MHSHWTTLALTYLAAAVIFVPLARRLGLGAIIGYLGAGFAIGPWGLRLVTDPSQIVDLAEFGVVLMLFLIGLELEPKRLWAMRRPIFGWGTVQLIGSLALIAAIGWACMGFWPDGWQLAVVAGAALAMSSTAIGLATLNERNILQTTVGQSVLSVSLFQDIAAIPLLALIPLMAPDRVAGADAGHPMMAAARAFGMIAVIVLGGRLLLRPALRFIARSQTPEIFTAAALGLVVGTASLMQAVGLSMALGAFLAGVLLAESEYRRELETDIEPFKGLLLGLFFIAVGMGIDVGVVIHHPWQVAAIVAGFLVVKTLVLWGMEIGIPIPRLERPIFTLLLAQGGEFGFVVLQAAQGQQVIAADEAGVLTAAITLSMLLTPLLILVADRWWIPFLTKFSPRVKLSEIAEPQDAPVIIAGFGRYGQIIGRLLYANGIKSTVLEHDAEQVESLRKFGFRVHYGDATRLDLLRIAGAASAHVLVVAVDGIEPSLELVDIARENFPNLTIVARARNVQHWYQLNERGVKFIERETLDAALMSGRSALEAMGYEPHRARTLAMRFRRHSVQQLHELAPHFRDESKLVSLARAGRQQLEQLFAKERLDHPPVAPNWDTSHSTEEDFDEVAPATKSPSER
ncbi:glutathione-regulated potassium-efflux system protein KefC [Scleromatobacter humisilvae]|uniref:Glutathione-regulated potassium-efflux system protein KefC n=1 Tax=Scleromatobacter humisilvae TaxID=2897159 RepID=A0A9X1YCT1_9BURK|nr:glutathione-regulated potassium-efflux system protein KefC [Scleromatobacter humisilvae]MCK9684144.1 glutathione-regulated potassium-efflux system protein KefC [Scleromatobacter humisilvae]